METHLSEMQIKNLLDNNVSGDELLGIDAHLADCLECADLAAAAARERLPEGGPVSEADAEGHLEYETIEAYLEDRLPDVDREIADVHFRVCDECSADLADLSELRMELAADIGQSPVPAGGSEDSGSRGLWKIFVPAFALAAALVAFGIWYQNSSSETADATPTPSATPALALPSPTTAQVESTPEASPTRTPEAELASVLNDGGGRIGIDPEGNLKGVSAGPLEQAVRRALLDGRIDVDRSGSALKQGSGSLMGPGSGVPFALGSPVGAVVESSRPAFRWAKLAGAESYRVEVYDESFNRVAQSPELKTTSWTPAKPLPRGKTYRWQVTASKAEEEVRSPVRPAPDARFRVISAADSNLIAAARRTNGNSHLVMGIAYAKAGMLTEAEREFAALVRKNPGSTNARKLLQQVRSER